MKHVELKRAVTELKDLAENRNKELTATKNLSRSIYADEYIANKERDINNTYGDKFNKLSEHFVCICDSTKQKITSEIESSKPLDYEMKLNNMLLQLNSLSADTIAKQGSYLKERLATFKDDPIARETILGIIKKKDPMLTLDLFDTSTDKLSSSLENAKKIINGSSIYGDTLTVKLMQIDNLLAGKFYEAEKVSEAESVAMTSYLKAIALGRPPVLNS